MAPRPKHFVADYPEVAAQWDYGKNGDAHPERVAAGSPLVYHWKCPVADDHVWKRSPNARIKINRKGRRKKVELRGCPYCAGKLVSVTNSLATLYPEIAAEWHPTKNGDNRPDTVTSQAGGKFWWKCPVAEDHEWPAPLSNRVSNGSGCPCCAGRQVSITNCLATLYPELAEQFHPTKNEGMTPSEVLGGTAKKYWWKCPVADDHVWDQSPNQRVSKDADCPQCRGLRVSVTNSLATRYPRIARLWHPKRNRKIIPADVTYGSKVSYWWKCPRGPDHEWERSPNAMTNEKASLCPFCSNQMVSVTNSLATRFPKIAAEFHPIKNIDAKTGAMLSAHDVLAGSSAEAWWVCSADSEHEWPAPIVRRTANNTGCPWCRIVPRSKVEIMIAFELAFVLGFDPKRHKIRINKRLHNVDVLIRCLKTIVEYDGSYYHKGKEQADKRKTKQLEKGDWTVIRIRERPLSRLGDHDIVVPVTRYRDVATVKKTVDMTLRELKQIHKLSDTRISNYLRRKTLANSANAERYVHAMLTAKSRKKPK